jgi:hypothetical protein
MAWLGEVLPKDRQDGATPFAPRTNRISSRSETDGGGYGVDQNGNPVCSELWPGNTVEAKSLTGRESS